jgi:beta-ketoacyl ACP synthase
MATLRTGDGLTDVVVTAVVSSTALAAEAEDSWRRLLEGESGVRFLDKEFVEQFKSPVRIGAELRENFDEHLNRVERRRLSYMQKMAVVLSRRLWESAGSPTLTPPG